MESIGTILRETRKQQGKSIEDIYKETKVSIDHLKQLENDNFTFLPQTYVKSFLKNYALCLGLNSNELLSKYEELNKPKVEVEIKPQSEKPVSKPKIQTDDRPVYFWNKENVLEWALGIGTFVLLLSLGYVYMQYRAQIFAKPVEDLKIEQTEEYIDLAEISLGKSGAEESVSPLELQIKARKKIQLKVLVDAKKENEYTMVPDQHLIWIARERFDIQLRQVVVRSKKNDSRKPSEDDSEIKLSFSTDDLKKDN